jgi:hypothetical protein
MTASAGRDLQWHKDTHTQSVEGRGLLRAFLESSGLCLLLLSIACPATDCGLITRLLCRQLSLFRTRGAKSKQHLNVKHTHTRTCQVAPVELPPKVVLAQGGQDAQLPGHRAVHEAAGDVAVGHDAVHGAIATLTPTCGVWGHRVSIA